MLYYIYSSNVMVYIAFIIQLIIFLFLTLVCFTLPGTFLLNKSIQKFSFWEKNVLGTTIGFTFFTLLSYLLLVLKIHYLLMPIIFIISLLTLKSFLSSFQQINFFSAKKIIVFLFVFIIGVLGQLAIIAPSGSLINGDLVFWSSHAHDSSWHIALAEEIKRGYPFQSPIFAGEKLVNYHYFSDIPLADFNKYFKFSLLNLYFRFFPLIFSVLLGSLSFLLGKKIGGNFLSGLWAMLFTYFCGSFGYIVTYIQHQNIGGETLFWASQIQSSIGNPPQIISLIIILSFLCIFYLFTNKNEKSLFLVCSILAGSLAVFKIYGGIVILTSMGIVSILQLLKERKISLLFLFLLSLFLSATLYLPNSSKTSSFLIFEPWWFIRTMVAAPDRLNWLDLELRRQTYLSEGNFKRVISLEVLAFLIFLVGNLGTRFLGLVSLVKISKKIFQNYFNAILVSITIISFILPMLFLQRGVASNTIQFFQYLLLILGLLAGVTTGEIFKKIKPLYVKVIMGIIIVLLSVPTQLALIQSFYSRAPFAKIDQRELVALKFLKELPDGIVLTPPYDKSLDIKGLIPYIWDWSDTAYVAAFSAKRVFLADTEQADILGYSFRNRLAIQQQIFKELEPKTFINLLRINQVRYLYFPKLLSPKVDLNSTPLEKIYSNDFVEIWRFN